MEKFGERGKIVGYCLEDKQAKKVKNNRDRNGRRQVRVVGVTIEEQEKQWGMGVSNYDKSKVYKRI